VGSWTWTSFAQFVAVIVPSALTAYVLFRSRTPALLKDELQVTRERCVRIEAENKDLKAADHAKDIQITELKAKTDLESVKAQMAAIQQQIVQESSDTKLTIVGMIQSVSKDIMTGFAKHSEDDRVFQARVCGILDRLEVRTGVSGSPS
jgi:hypothetical protein